MSHIDDLLLVNMICLEISLFVFWQVEAFVVTMAVLPSAYEVAVAAGSISDMVMYSL